MVNSRLILLLFILFLSETLIVYAEAPESCIKGAKCFTQSQMNCFFFKLSPVFIVFIVLSIFIFIRYEKKILKLSAKQKILGLGSIILFFYLISFLLVRLFFVNSCI